MKKLIAASVLTLACLNQVHAQEQGSIPTLRDLRNEAKVIIKDFELTDLKIDAGAPEYRAIRDIMHENIKTEIAALDVHLDDLNKQLSTDYSLIVSLKKNERNDAALRRTIEVATQRLEAKANELTGAYHNRLRSLILLTPYQMPLLKKCLTVLCTEKVNLDFQRWFKKAKTLNRSLDLEVTEMKEIPKFAKVLKAEDDRLENSKLQVSNYLPVAITKEQYEDHVRAEQAKVDEAARIAREKAEAEARAKREKEEQIAKEEATRQAKAEKLKRRENQPYGCTKLEENKANEVYKCVDPYKLINGVKSNINDVSVVYKDICAAHNLTVPSLNYPWVGGKSQTDNGYYYTSVTCVDSVVDVKERFNFSKTFLTDGSMILNDVTVKINGGTARLKSINEAHEVCELFGYKSAQEPKTSNIGWNGVYAIAMFDSNAYDLNSVYNTSVMTSFKCVK